MDKLQIVIIVMMVIFMAMVLTMLFVMAKLHGVS